MSMKYTSFFVLIVGMVLIGAACSKQEVSNVTNQVVNTVVNTVSNSTTTGSFTTNTNTTTVTNTVTNVASVLANSNLNVNTATTASNALPIAQRVADSVSTLSSPVKVPTIDGQRYFIVGQPKGQNSKATKKIIFSLPGHGSTAEQDYEAWRPSITDNDYAIASLNWWDGSGETTADYYTPNQVLTQIRGYLDQQGYDSADFVVLEGFSRGSANTYAVKSYDQLNVTHVLDAVISASGKYQADFPMAPGGSATPKLFNGVPWILVCGGKDDNPTRDGCPGMTETKTWLTGQGANVLGLLEDPNSGHGAFHTSSLKLVDQALTLLNALPAAK